MFLGYPLKDVRGFTEKRSLPLVDIGRWQVFGEAGESMQLMRLHKKAKEVFLKFIENQQNPLPVRERLNWHFGKVKGRAMIRHLDKIQDSRFKIQDSRLKIQDSGYGIRLDGIRFNI